MRVEMGGEIVFFCHDSDHDCRETQTILRDRRTGDLHTLNFAFENKVQRKYSPLFLKRIPDGWHANTARQLPNYVDPRWVEAFKSVSAGNAADFCLAMYRAMGLLEGVRVVRSSNPSVRADACDVEDCFVDVPHEGEIVRARLTGGELKLHEGGPSFITLPRTPYTKEHVSPTRDTRLRWMQSVVRCTHYIAGAGEQAYLNKSECPEITFVNRDPIDRSDEAWIDEP